MKRNFTTLCLLLVTCMMSAQTATDLIEKYKSFPGAEYKNMTEERKKEVMEGYEKGEYANLTKKEFDAFYKGIDLTEQVQITMDDLQKAALQKEMSEMKDYELLFSVEKNQEQEESSNPFVNFLRQQLDMSHIKATIYGKTKKGNLREIIMCVDLFGKTILNRSTCNLTSEHMKKLTEADGLDEDLMQVDYGLNTHDMWKEAREGNALIVVDGKERPEFKTPDDLSKWLKENNLDTPSIHLMPASEAKDKYPTDKKVVVEYTTVKIPTE